MQSRCGVPAGSIFYVPPKCYHMNPTSDERPPEKPHRDAGGEPTGTGYHQLPPLDSRTLLEGSNERLILHQGELYRLRQTRSGKLILYK